MNKKIEDVLRGFNQNQLREINSFLSSAQGERLKKKLGAADRDRLLDEFSKLDPDDVKRRLAQLSDRELRNIISKL